MSREQGHIDCEEVILKRRRIEITAVHRRVTITHGSVTPSRLGKWLTPSDDERQADARAQTLVVQTDPSEGEPATTHTHMPELSSFIEAALKSRGDSPPATQELNPRRHGIYLKLRRGCDLTFKQLKNKLNLLRSRRRGC
jgi:hypothetical protein